MKYIALDSNFIALQYYTTEEINTEAGQILEALHILNESTWVKTELVSWGGCHSSL